MTKLLTGIFKDAVEFDNEEYYFKNEAAKLRYYDNELKKWLKVKTPFICFDEETIERLYEMETIIYDWIDSESICLAEKRMSAVAMGFDAYDVQDTSGDYSYCLKKALNRAFHNHIETYKVPKKAPKWLLDGPNHIEDDDLPF